MFDGSAKEVPGHGIGISGRSGHEEPKVSGKEQLAG
jgi:hypothetical protein